MDFFFPPRIVSERIGCDVMVDARQINKISERNLHECHHRIRHLFLHHKSISFPKPVRDEVSRDCPPHKSIIHPSQQLVFHLTAASKSNRTTKRKRADWRTCVNCALHRTTMMLAIWLWCVFDWVNVDSPFLMTCRFPFVRRRHDSTDVRFFLAHSFCTMWTMWLLAPPQIRCDAIWSTIECSSWKSIFMRRCRRDNCVRWMRTVANATFMTRRHWNTLISIPKICAESSVASMRPSSTANAFHSSTVSVIWQHSDFGHAIFSHSSNWFSFHLRINWF